MTCEEMRAEMRRKVVPENVIPQNIIEYLMDDTAELPELDAFTFLNRLRALGIGSADFQYLLEACDAPAACVEKVKRNPAMNLQNLILTLESSGLTSQDYTIMLYTARQIWEQTLTIRLEKTSEAVEEAEEEIEENPGQIPVEELENAVQPEAAPEENADEDDEDFDEPSLAEVLEQVRLLEREMSYHGDDEEEHEKLPEIASEEPEAPSLDNAEIAYDEEPEQSARSVDGLTSDFSKIFDIIKENKQAERDEAQSSAPEADEYEYEEESEEPVAKSVGALPTGTLSVTKILAGMQKAAPQNDDIGDEDSYEDEEEIDEISAEEAEISADEDYEDENFEDTSSLVHIDQTLFKKSAKQVPARELPDEDEDDDEPLDEEDYDEDEEYEDYDDELSRKIRRTPKKYHIKALVAGAVGAAALTVLSVAAARFTQKAPEIFFAEQNEDIFSQIYKSYNAKIMGGDNICEYSDSCEIFGDLLINKNGATSFSDDKNVYTITSEKISAESFDGTMLSSAKYITPPAKTEFVTAFEQDGALYCVFSGDKGENECGYMKIQNGTTLFTVRQDGILTDLSLEDGKISLGSVYVPKYSRTFSTDDTDVYLPCLGKDEKKPLTAENVALSGTDGCSFAVCAEYTLASGENSAAKAVLGNPVSASADFRAALNGKTEDKEYGLLIDFKDTLSAKKCEKITAAAFGKDFAVTLEGENANLRNADFTAKCALSNFAENAEKLKVMDKNLLVGNKDGFFSAFDCTNLAEPSAVKLTKTNGIVSGDNAALFSVDGGLTITYYKKEDGAAKVLGTYRKAFSDDDLKTLVLKGAETTAFADDSCGAAFEYFDGVSVVAQYVVFGKNEGLKTLYDDKTGFTRAFAAGGKIYAVSSNGFDCVTGKSPLTE